MSGKAEKKKRAAQAAQAARERAASAARRPLWLPVALAVVAAVLAVAVAASFLAPGGQGSFEPPAFEEAAQPGMPAEGDVPAQAGFSEIYKEGMPWAAWLCGVPVAEEGSLAVWFANSEGSGVWMKLRVLDGAGKMLGESGLLKPGEHVRAVALSRDVSPGDGLKLKIMAYEPDTYYSAGSVGVSVTVG